MDGRSRANGDRASVDDVAVEDVGVACCEAQVELARGGLVEVIAAANGLASDHARELRAEGARSERARDRVEGADPFTPARRHQHVKADVAHDAREHQAEGARMRCAAVDRERGCHRLENAPGECSAGEGACEDPGDDCRGPRVPLPRRASKKRATRPAPKMKPTRSPPASSVTRSVGRSVARSSAPAEAAAVTTARALRSSTQFRATVPTVPPGASAIGGTAASPNARTRAVTPAMYDPSPPARTTHAVPSEAMDRAASSSSLSVVVS